MNTSASFSLNFTTTASATLPSTGIGIVYIVSLVNLVPPFVISNVYVCVDSKPLEVRCTHIIYPDGQGGEQRTRIKAENSLTDNLEM